LKKNFNSTANDSNHFHPPNPQKTNEFSYDPYKFFQYLGQNEQNNHTFFDNFHQSNHFEKEQISDLFLKNKLLPGLAGWVTLDDPKAEKNELDLIDVNYLREENNDNMDFHLKKFFEEDKKEFQLSPSQNPFNMNANARKGSTLNRNKKINTGIKTMLPSFFENLENSLSDFIENSNLNNFSEFARHHDVMTNIENYFFIEQQRENNEEFNTSNYAFSKHFHNNYSKLIERLKNYNDNKKLDVKLLLQIMSSFSINIISDLIKFIKMCDKSFCFDVLKFQNQAKSQTVLTKPKENNNFYSQDLNFSMTHVKLDNESLFSVDSKRNRKGWTSSETEFLERIVKNYFPHQIPNEIIEDFSKKCNRSVFSIQAKIQKMKKVLQKKTEMDFKKTEELHVEEEVGFYNNNDNIELIEVPENGEFLNSNENSNSFGTSILGTLSKRSMNSGTKGNNKYDISLENMIKITLKEFPRHMASKSEILTKMEELFFAKNCKNDSKWKMSTSQLLASCKSFKKFKGTYGLNEKNITKEILNHITMNNPKNDLNRKLKLILILSKIPGKRAEINEITHLFIQYFKEKESCNDEKSVKTSIQKVLKQYSEFDTSQSKTCYMLSSD